MHRVGAWESRSVYGCGRAFTPRHRRQGPAVLPPRLSPELDADGRRRVAEAIADGMLTLDALRTGAAVTPCWHASGRWPPSREAVENPQDVSVAYGNIRRLVAGAQLTQPASVSVGVLQAGPVPTTRAGV